MNREILVEAKNLTKKFGDFIAVNSINEFVLKKNVIVRKRKRIERQLKMQGR